MVAIEPPEAIAVLIAEHDLCRQFLDRAKSALTVAEHGDSAALDSAFSLAWELLRFLEEELEVHIAKEEGPLFPRLKAALPADDRLIDEMIAEHDLIRIKRSEVRKALARLLDDHDELRLNRAALRGALLQQGGQGAPPTELQHAIDVVAGKLRVHFENEEDLVFPLTPELLSAAILTEVTDEMDAIESRGRSA